MVSFRQIFEYMIVVILIGFIIGLTGIVFHDALAFGTMTHNIDSAINYANQECDQCLMYLRDYGYDEYGHLVWHNMQNLYVTSMRDLERTYKSTTMLGFTIGFLFGGLLMMIGNLVWGQKNGNDRQTGKTGKARLVAKRRGKAR